MYRFIYGAQPITSTRKVIQLARLNYSGSCGHYLLIRQIIPLSDDMYLTETIHFNESSESVKSVHQKILRSDL